MTAALLALNGFVRWIITARAPVLLLILALGLAVAGGMRISALKVELAQAQAATAKAETALQAERADRAAKFAEAVERARREDAATITAQRKALDEAHEKTAALRGAASRASAASRSLRDELAAARASAAAAAADPVASEGCKATAQTAAVLSDLLGRCSERRRELAQYADEARVAGELCVANYEALKPEPEKSP